MSQSSRREKRSCVGIFSTLPAYANKEIIINHSHKSWAIFSFIFSNRRHLFKRTQKLSHTEESTYVSLLGDVLSWKNIMEISLMLVIHLMKILLPLTFKISVEQATNDTHPAVSRQLWMCIVLHTFLIQTHFWWRSWEAERKSLESYLVNKIK